MRATGQGETMTIGIDAQWLRAPNTGIGKCTENWLRHLAELDSSTKYVLFGWEDPRPCAEAPGSVPAQENFCYVDTPPGRLEWPGKGAVIVREQWSIWAGARTHGCTLLFYPYFNASVFTLRRAIVTITDLAIYLQRTVYPFARRTYYNTLLRLASRNALALVAISENTKADAIQHLGVAADRIHVVYPGIDEQFRPIDRRRARQWCAEHKGIASPFVLYTGGLSWRKNTRRMLDAFSLARSRIDRDVHLILTGNLETESAAHGYKQDGEQAGAVITLGSIPESELPYLYSAAEVVLYPSLYEGFGLPIVEAHACGTPVITSKASSMPEIAGDGAILVNPYDEEEIAAALVNVLTQATVREVLSARGLKNARRFSWRTGASDLLALFREYGQHPIALS